MKITRTDPLYVQPQPQRKADAAPAAQPRATAQGEARISATAQTINQARSELASTSDVDMEKVNRIRQAISEGRLELDMDALSQAILDMHRR
ncbi:flagellar biosynthesis anti-sigma factor FlgM [Aeromonas sp. FDAARGOS 1415]|uniref:flagellar biosynthesis anti-sigma factor FlgM n=1 Tax=Aeromonas TaxID=642 RepID=UPI001C20F7C9|nr:flagellar biosynthesis anti-sigma factor FlgM [Aeromonas sp. FDAARGOS 1415]QXB56343.1 flagellar biosynthesis anti-sigma factor FlgM [Aeromonas sp. FDAARGOS 1415]